MLRCSLGGLLLLVLVLSFYCAGLAYATAGWARAVVISTLLLLLLSALVTIGWRRNARWFAAGFSLTGWLCLFVLFESSLAATLDVDDLAGFAFDKLHAPRLEGADSKNKLVFRGEGASIVILNDEPQAVGLGIVRQYLPRGGASAADRDALIEIVSCLGVFLAACAGGAFTSILRRASSTPRAPV